MTVLSVVRGNNAHIVAEAAKLWIEDTDVILDVTHGRGLWWGELFPTDYNWRKKHDLAEDGVDFRELPESDESIDVVFFDPPYVSMGGRQTSGLIEFMDRYGLEHAPAGVREMMTLHRDGIFEATRVLKPKGRLFAKSQDYISSGKYVQGHHNIVASADEAGLVQADEFVHVRGPGPQPVGRRQVHSRRAHSFLSVFQKPPCSPGKKVRRSAS